MTPLLIPTTSLNFCPASCTRRRNAPFFAAALSHSLCSKNVWLQSPTYFEVLFFPLLRGCSLLAPNFIAVFEDFGQFVQFALFLSSPQSRPHYFTPWIEMQRRRSCSSFGMFISSLYVVETFTALRLAPRRRPGLPFLPRYCKKWFKK